MEEFTIGEDFTILRINNETEQNQKVAKPLKEGLIQFHFVLKGRMKSIFNNGAYIMESPENKSLTLYNPQQALPIHFDLLPNTWVVSLLISIKKFHALFSEEAQYIPFLNKENQDKKYYAENDINPVMMVVLNQIMNFNIHESVRSLYYKGKIYELLSLIFNKSDSNDDGCPFSNDQDTIKKLKKAKEILVSNMAEPPSLNELADQTGLPLKKLKTSFKQLYGYTVYGFLFEYKMEYARKLLDSGTHNVNEVGIKIGYSTASHFIAAFKKRYGTTPKKYLISLSK